MEEEKISDDIAVEEASPKIKQPPMYKVVLFNDDYTPMDFVVFILQRFFSKNADESTKIMWQVHTRGKGICGVYTRDIAETKVVTVNDFSREHEHPLLCAMEPE